MAEYILLMKLTDKGAMAIDQAEIRQNQAVQVLEKLHGKLVDFWVTMGEYDYIAVGSVPTDETALVFALYLAMEGNVRTTTLPAFDLDTLRRATSTAMPFHK